MGEQKGLSIKISIFAENAVGLSLVCVSQGNYPFKSVFGIIWPIRSVGVCLVWLNFNVCFALL